MAPPGGRRAVRPRSDHRRPRASPHGTLITWIVGSVWRFTPRSFCTSSSILPESSRLLNTALIAPAFVESLGSSPPYWSGPPGWANWAGTFSAPFERAAWPRLMAVSISTDSTCPACKAVYASESCWYTSGLLSGLILSSRSSAVVPVCTPQRTFLASATVVRGFEKSLFVNAPWFDSKYGRVNRTTAARLQLIV